LSKRQNQQASYDLIEGFTRESLDRIADAITAKNIKQETISILELLKDSKLRNKASISKNFTSSRLIVGKWLDILECICAIKPQKLGVNVIYDITPVGEELLKIMKGD
jgi:hypothetical protein